MRYLHSIVQPLVDLVAAADIAAFDLPVNPLSFLLLRLQITNINVKHQGENIISGSLRDLMLVNMLYQKAFPWATKLTDTDNALRDFVFPLCLGRRPYDPKSCFPATTRGNLRFEMTAGADGAAYDDIDFSLEAVELIEAQPMDYLKYVTSARTSVIGQFDAPLPIGNPLLGVLLFDTGLFGSDDGVLSWGTIKLLKDNVEQYYPLSDYATLAGMLGLQLGMPTVWPGHVHAFNGAAAGLDNSDEQQITNSFGPLGYAYLDFDPLRDGSYVLETEGASNLAIRGNGGEATAVRYLPIEWRKVTK